MMTLRLLFVIATFSVLLAACGDAAKPDPAASGAPATSAKPAAATTASAAASATKDSKGW
jgi:hypothetical protein